MRSLTAFIQESGRAGRNNQKSVSILFRSVNQYQQNLNQSTEKSELSVSDFEKEDLSVLQDFVNTSTCRKKILYQYFDQTQFIECSDNHNPCDLCEQKQKNQQIIQQTLTQSVKENQLQEFHFLEKLTDYQHICCHCLLNYNSVSYSHSTTTCSVKHTMFVKKQDDFIRMKNQQQLLKSGSCCFLCLLPSKLCNNDKKTTQSCQFSTLIIDLLTLI